MDISDGIEKSWDHPWSTDEMRKRRREWSLAGDAGLLKHLQQFSENLVSKANKTQEALDSLTTELNETAILIDNVTNTSLALANTQFIESRVQEDDVEIEKKLEEPQHIQDTSAEDLIACVTESVKQGLCIMDEKYRRMEVVDSDSEDEDDAIVLSVIVGPNDPYQDRPLPYVIGSEKWKVSNKIGLESSSSESEQLDEEEEEETESEKEEAVRQRMFDASSGPKINIARLSSSSSESDNYNDQNNIAYMSNGKLDRLSQSNMNSVSESTTPVNNLPKAQVPSEPTSNFAEELAKRLGTVRQTQKPSVVDEVNEASINRFNDDLFTPEEEEGTSDNVYRPRKGLFDDQLSPNLWKEKPIKTFRTNIIPPSIDVPPPISTVSTKPKSAIDDLFADPDSEDSDDIFSSKNTMKKVTRDDKPDSKKSTTDNVQKKFLDTVAPATTGHMTTSTPETNINASNLFSDEEDDDGDLFGTSKRQSQKSDTSSIQSVNKKKPVGGVSILGKILTSDIENKLSHRAFRCQSSDSSSSDTTTNYDTGRSNEPVSEDNSRSVILNDNTVDQSFIVAAGNVPQNSVATTENSYSSGISIQPPSINNTAGSSIGTDFQPQMTSSRLRSEEIYRERVASDSLFNVRVTEPVSTTTNSTYQTANNLSQEQNTETSSSHIRQEDVFENEDLFGPPPLPKSDSKPTKSKVSSLFDDSDSGDELFSTTSSGSRSQKSTDLLATTPQYSDRRSAHRKGLFDEDIDIFGNKDSPDVDIFGTTSKPKEETKKTLEVPSNDLFGGKPRSTSSLANEKVQSTKPKKPSLFDDDIDDGDLFGIKFPRSERKPDTDLFREEDEDDLFSTKKTIDKKPENNLFSEKVSKSIEQPSVKPGTKNAFGNELFSSAVNVHGLLFEDDEYDDLFGKKTLIPGNVIKDSKAKATDTKEEIRSEPPKESPKTEEKSIEPSTSALMSANTVATAEGTALESSPPTRNEVEEEKIKNIPSDAAEEATFDNVKKSPPKTLNIRAAPSPPSEESTQIPRRTVSGKIKNLMGKVGDLKILSPMDTPPLWRKSEEKTDEEEDIADRDSDDGGCISTQSRNSPPSTSESSTARKSSSPLTITDASNVEVAISFDEPAQIETLSTVASKSRVRIQAKRRPQSRHARKSAIRQSGIDFDTVDAAEDTQADSTRELFNPNITGSVHTITSDAEQTTAPVATEAIRPDTFLVADDKSELGSLSKESSMSANKNTLLSPSTDEEDLFDVPPDLPEDPQKEDTLFGRAPILSPIENVSEKNRSDMKPLRDTIIGRTEISESSIESASKVDDREANISADDVRESTENTVHLLESQKPTKIQSSIENEEERDSNDKQHSEKTKEQIFDEESTSEVIDPLRDSTHDPLKDPSQLFAFVTKTPSPEKGKSLLFSEDDSLFLSGPKMATEERANKKQVLDLFADDPGDDLFSAPLTKTVKKPLKETKISLFDDDNQEDEDDSLFGSVAKRTPKIETVQKIQVMQSAQKKTSFFDDDDDTNLFSEQSEQKSESARESRKNELFAGETSKASSLKDIFGDQSSGEDDIFAARKSITKKIVSSKSLFPSEDDEDGGIFEKLTTSNDVKVKSTGIRPPVKKSMTRDLKKTAEKIVEDPLSLLQDD